ncbi:alpha/beta hydrolase [Brasilonema bromeliae]|uniref:alpha/beta hydrolase n=1 Tax=Brasilonema bromeliae TaxID=383615 RepID=UPI0030D7EDE6
MYSNSAIAAEKIVLKYGIFRESVSVEKLTKFAETGEVSPMLNLLLNQARQDPQTVRNVLTKEVNASPVVLDRLLNNPIGEFLVDQIGQTIHTPSSEANPQALRSALVLSANKDNKVSLIEIIQNYPTQEVYVEGERLVRTYDQLSLLAERLQNLLSWRE